MIKTHLDQSGSSFCTKRLFFWNLIGQGVVLIGIVATLAGGPECSTHSVFLLHSDIFCEGKSSRIHSVVCRLFWAYTLSEGNTCVLVFHAVLLCGAWLDRYVIIVLQSYFLNANGLSFKGIKRKSLDRYNN